MRQPKTKITLLALSLCVALSASGCGHDWSASATRPTTLNHTPTIPPAAPPAMNEREGDAAIRLLEERVKRDPEDFSALNNLAHSYLQRARETGSAEYIELAARAARRSLASVPEVRNTGGLAALTGAEFAAHEFAAARDHALELTRLDPGKSYPYGMMGDAQLELGAYDEAERAFRQMERVGGMSHSSETRQARLAFLHGDAAATTRHLTNALALALDLPVPPRETVAWYRWQLGESAFAVGDYSAAERHYNDALITFPDYFRAVAGLGRVRAANGDINGAIEHYERIVNRLPDPVFVATLGDLYQLAGREHDANRQYQLVERIAQLDLTRGVFYNRQLALFYADHDMKPEEAYASAMKEYEIRRDIYGADALAWTAFKSGRIKEAQAAMKEALRLGTKDARLLYHAGLIARAAGDEVAARNHLQQALKLNPQFDSLQASLARKALEG